MIALSPLAMAQSNNSAIAQGGSYMLAQAQGDSQSREQTAQPSEQNGSQDQNAPAQDEQK